MDNVPRLRCMNSHMNQQRAQNKKLRRQLTCLSFHLNDVTQHSTCMLKPQSIDNISHSSAPLYVRITRLLCFTTKPFHFAVAA